LVCSKEAVPYHLKCSIAEWYEVTGGMQDCIRRNLSRLKNLHRWRFWSPQFAQGRASQSRNCVYRLQTRVGLRLGLEVLRHNFFIALLAVCKQLLNL